MNASKIREMVEWIQDAESILIGAGSGMSIDSGINYTDRKAFAEQYRTLSHIRRNFPDCFEADYKAVNNN